MSDASPNLVPTRVQLNRPLPPLTYLAPEALPVGTKLGVVPLIGAGPGTGRPTAPRGRCD